MNIIRKGIPEEMKRLKGREKNSWLAVKHDGGCITVNSYATKTNLRV